MFSRIRAQIEGRIVTMGAPRLDMPANYRPEIYHTDVGAEGVENPSSPFTDSFWLRSQVHERAKCVRRHWCITLVRSDAEACSDKGQIHQHCRMLSAKIR